MHMKTVTDANIRVNLLSVSITQHVTTEQKDAIIGKPAVAIKCSKISDKVLAFIHKPVLYANRKEEICARYFGCFSVKHPKSKTIFEWGDWLISLESTHFLERISYNDGLDQYRPSLEKSMKRCKSVVLTLSTASKSVILSIMVTVSCSRTPVNN